MRSTELVPANLRSILSRMKQAGTVKAASIQAEGGESLMVRQASAGGTTAATRTIMEHDRARVGVARGRTGHASGASATWARVGGGGSAGAGASDSEQRVSAAQGPPPTRGRTARRQYFTGTQATFRLSPLLWPGLFRFVPTSTRNPFLSEMPIAGSSVGAAQVAVSCANVAKAKRSEIKLLRLGKPPCRPRPSS